MRDGLRRWSGVQRLGAFAPLALVLLAACPPRQDAGFEKVAVRSGEDIPRIAMPDPPPVTAAIASPAVAGPVVIAEMPAGVTQEMIDDGQRLYATVCVACHGAAGAGSAVGPALDDQSWIHITGAYPEIVTIIIAGVPQPVQYPTPMPARGGGPFTDDEIRAVAAYVYAISQP